MSFERVAVLGLGKVGKLAAILLHEAGFQVVGIDARDLRSELPFDVKAVDVAAPDALKGALAPHQAVLSCLPYHLNKQVAVKKKP